MGQEEPAFTNSVHVDAENRHPASCKAADQPPNHGGEGEDGAIDNVAKEQRPVSNFVPRSSKKGACLVWRRLIEY